MKKERILNPYFNINPKGKKVVYWMSRDQRVKDNWALLYAQDIAMQNKLPLEIVFLRFRKTKEIDGKILNFMDTELSFSAYDAKMKNISISQITGTIKDDLTNFFNENQPALVVTDFSPLKSKTKWIDTIREKCNITPVIVDTHNLIPPWIVSNKQEYAARTIRSKLNERVKEYLDEIPEIKKHPYGNAKIIGIKDQERKSPPQQEIALDKFINNISDYKEKNDPVKDSTSRLSKYIHFGNLSIQRIILEVIKKSRDFEARDLFIEELLIRRELSENFCYYNENYDNYAGLADWAKRTLEHHSEDGREYTYSYEEFEQAKTHDQAWNAAQQQLLKTGFMHGYMRMYWAKKILEWTSSPKEAIQIAIKLNDKYQLDGRDPNGYVGILWSIGGLHDRPWFDRPVYGQIRYMNYNGLKRKFNIEKYIRKWIES